MFIFEVLVVGFAFFLQMQPVLQNHATDFAAQILDPQRYTQHKYTLHTEQPIDGGRSWLPFNLLLAKEIQRITGIPTEVNAIANQPNHYWLPLKTQGNQFLIFNHHEVVGTNLIETFVSWVTLAIIFGLAISTWLARGLARPIVELRERLHEHTKTTACESLQQIGIIELDQLQQEFVAQTKKLALAIDDRTTLLMGLSHELGSPVARLTMALELYAQPIQKDKRDDMQSDLDEMRRIIEQFLFAAHCLCPLDLAQSSLSELIAKLQQRYVSMHQIQINPPLHDIEYAINITALERILINLIDNAQRHAKDSVITVDTIQAHKKLILTVSDSGPGIAEADINRLFSPFEKRSASPGVGLGLALSRLMAEQNGWELTLKNRATGGLQASVVISVNSFQNSKF